MSMAGFPLLLIPLAIYNIFVFLMPGVAFIAPAASLALPSGTDWTATFGDALLALALVLLLFEVIKASRPGGRYLTDHLLSLIVCGAAIAEFVLLAPFATSTFFLLTVMTAVEFIAGVVNGLRRRPPADAAPPQPRRGRASEPTFTPPVAAPPPTPAAEAPPPAAPAPAAEPVPPKPAPSLAIVRTERDDADAVRDTPAASPAPSQPASPPPSSAQPPVRDVSTWSVSDLIADREPGSPATRPDAPAPKP